MEFDKASAVTIIVGSSLFLAAAFSPISRVFGTPDAARRLDIILGAPNQWILAQVLFAIGAIVTVGGLGWLAFRLPGHPSSIWLNLSGVLMALGAVLWTWHVYQRAVEPALFAAGELPDWPFAAYSLLTMVGLALLGAALLGMGLAVWVGWLAIGSAGAFFALAIVFRDMPPFVYYSITLIVGIMLYRAAVAAAGGGVGGGIATIG